MSYIGVAGSGRVSGSPSSPVGADIEDRDALVVQLFAEVEPLDAAGVADVRQAHQTVRLMDVAQGDVAEAGRQVRLGEDDALLLADAEQRSAAAPLDVDVGRQHGRQRRGRSADAPGTRVSLCA